jgi:hypothetical protein
MTGQAVFVAAAFVSDTRRIVGMRRALNELKTARRPRRLPVFHMTRIITVSVVMVSVALGAVPCVGPAPTPLASRECCMADCAAEMTAPHDAMPRPVPVPVDCCVVAAGRDAAVLTPVVTPQAPLRTIVVASSALDVPAAAPAPANDRAARARSAPRSAPATALLI